jgi:hypothetical protein
MNLIADIGVREIADDNLEAHTNMHLANPRELSPGYHQNQCITTNRHLQQALAFTIHYLSKATRQPKTALWRGGWVAPVGPTPTAMVLRHADADDEVRRPISAIAMIDAGALWTWKVPIYLTRRSGVKSTVAWNSQMPVSLSPEGATIKEGTSRRKLVNLGMRNPGNRVDNAPEVRDNLWIISGSPGGMLRSPTGRNNAATERGNRRALSTRKGRAGLWPHARAGQVGHQAKVRGNARNTPNCPQGHQDQLTKQQP